MPTISTCLIVKNEADIIARCLNSILPFSDEIIIYDTGSDDGTQDVCRAFDKVRVIQGEWRNDFAWARNESFKYATCDYVMWVDADDYITEENIKWLINFKNTELEKYTRVDLEYIYDMSEDGSYSEHFYRERIFKRSLNPQWYGRIHEFVSAYGADAAAYMVPFEDFSIYHYKHSPNPIRNLLIYKDMERKGEIKSGRDWFYYGQECMWHVSNEVAEEKFAKALECKDLWCIDKLNLYMAKSKFEMARGDYEKAKNNALLAATCTMIPRADVCCRMGDIYEKIDRKDVAWYWYKMAEDNVPQGLDSTFMEKDKSNVYPLLKLCVLAYENGDINESIRYNNKALSFDPKNEGALFNKKFFDTLSEK